MSNSTLILMAAFPSWHNMVKLQAYQSYTKKTFILNVAATEKNAFMSFVCLMVMIKTFKSALRFGGFLIR